MLFRKRAERKRWRIRKLRLLALLSVLLLLSAASFSVGLITAIAGELPSLDPARTQSGAVDGYIYSDNGKTVLAVLRGSEARVLVDWDQISPWMKHAIVDVEDKRFYEHRGIDMHGIVRAAWADIRHKSVVQGGSTITQQFVKNALTHNEQSISRKLKEAALAWQLESGPKHWSKIKILTAYLNTIYFGNGAYGVETASKTYFGHGASTLTLAEAALLAGIPEDPTSWDPVTNPRAAKARRRVVLQTMLDQEHITQAAFVRANKAPLPKPEDVHLPSGQNLKAPYFTNYVKQLLVDTYGSSTVFGGGLRVRTSINMRLQQDARNAISNGSTRRTRPSAALVAIDPRNGRVLAMIGGNNYRKSQFNLAVQGERQPGSSFKPFVLATALEEGVAPATSFVSRPIVLSLDGTTWPVHNYEGAYLGRIDLQQATIHSDNSVYAQLTKTVTPGGVARTARKQGITSPLKPYLSIGLGGQAVNPLEMARAYAAFANGGFRVDGSLTGNHPRAIIAVGDKHATDVECGGAHVHCNHLVARRALREDTAAAVSAILAACRPGGNRHARRAAGSAGRRQDGHDRELRRRVVRRVHAAARHGGVGRLPGQAGADDDAVPRRPGRGRDVSRAHLEDVHADGAEEVGRAGRPRGALFPDAAVVLRPQRASSGATASWSSTTATADGADARVLARPRSDEHADCKPNEVDVPSVVGDSVTDALRRLTAQPLTPSYVYKPAKPGQRLGFVVAQFPAKGTLSSYDRVMLVVPHAAPRRRAERRRARPAPRAERSYEVGEARARSSASPTGSAGACSRRGRGRRRGRAAGMSSRLVVGRRLGTAGSGSASPPGRSATVARPPS